MLALNERFDFDGRAVAWGRFGAGPPLVLVHGFPWSAQSWRRLAPRLAERRTVYVFDLLGAGASEKAPQVPPQIQGRLLARLLAHWGVGVPEVVAHDFGGLAALRAHFIEGAPYRRLVLADVVAVTPSGSPLFSHIRRHEDAFAGLPPYAHEALFRAYVQQAAARPLSDEAMSTYLEPFSGAQGQPAFYRWIAQSDIAAIEEAQARYRPPEFPVRLIWGEVDRWIPPSQGLDLAKRLGAPAPTLIAGAGHLVQEDAPEAFQDALADALVPEPG